MNPYITLCSNVLPMFAEDAREMVTRIINLAKARGEEIDIDDGFDLYRQLATIRRLFVNALPEYDFLDHFSPINQLTQSVSLFHSMWRACWRSLSGGGFA